MTRYVYTLPHAGQGQLPYTSVTVCTDAGATVPADIQTLTGASIAGGVIDATHSADVGVQFLGPDGVTSSLYVVLSSASGVIGFTPANVPRFVANTVVASSSGMVAQQTTARRILAAANRVADAGSTSPLALTRTVTDGVTATSTVITSATANFTRADIGKVISGTGVTAGTYIVSLNSASSVNVSAATTASASSVALTIVGDVTVTFTPNTSTSTLSTPRYIHPKLSTINATTGGLIDTVNDAHFTYEGLRIGHGTISSGDCFRPDLLVGGTLNGQSRRDNIRFGWEHTGQACEVGGRATSTSVSYRVWLDDLLLTESIQTVTGLTAGQRYLIKIDYGSVQSHKVQIELTDPEFIGVYINGVTDSMTKAHSMRPSTLFEGCSIEAGAQGVSFLETYAWWVARYLGTRYTNTAIGGSGFSTPATGAYADRLADLVTHNPDFILVGNPYNDAAGQTQAQLTALATTYLTSLRSALPNAVIMVMGSWHVNHNNTPTIKAADDAMKAAALALSMPFISWQDPLGQRDTVAAFVPSATYALGAYCTQDGYLWVKTGAAGAAQASWNSTEIAKWKVTGFIGGTGKTTALAADGNADTYINGADGVHPTLAGSKASGYFVAQQIIRQLRTLAA
jgi:hypothetical protein